jgi:Calcineurin-like phosphoesterase
MGVRLAVLAIATAVVVAALIAVGGSDDKGGRNSIPAGHAAEQAGTDANAEAGSPYLGPGGGDGWAPSRAEPNSTVWAVGDAADGSTTAEAVAGMVANHRVDRVIYLGDVYGTGTAAEFASNYRPIYGRFDAITAPTIGNHEWPNIATGYVPYWTAARGTPPPLRYAFAVSGWQLISLNSNLPTDAAQERWLRQEIRSTPRYGNCRIAFMHHPRYSAGLHGDLTGLQGIFDELRGHASIALAGHDHDMQRLHPIDGITPYVDGSGGNELYPVNRDDPRLAFFDDTHHGALRIRLRPDRAALAFVDQDGGVLDRSTVTCNQS